MSTTDDSSKNNINTYQEARIDGSFRLSSTVNNTFDERAEGISIYSSNKVK